MKFLFTKKMKNIVCLVGLILLGFFVLKHFNLIEGMVEGVEGGGGGGGGGGLGYDSDGKKNSDKKGPYSGGNGNYTVNINVEAPKMDSLSPTEYNNNVKTTE